MITNPVCRPLGVYAIAVWMTNAHFFLTGWIRRLYRESQPAGGAEADLTALLYMVALGLYLYIVIGLIRLEKTPLRLALGVIGAYTVMLAVNGLPGIYQGAFTGGFAIFLAASLPLNILAIWYLSRPSFKARCQAYREAAGQVARAGMIEKGR